MTKQELKTLVKIEQDLRDARRRLFLVYTEIGTKSDELRALKYRLKRKAAKREDTKGK